MKTIRLCLLASLFAYSHSVDAEYVACEYALSTLIDKVATNYAGYPDKNNDSLKLKTNLILSEISQNNDNKCLPHLQRWLNIFSDPYMQIYPLDQQPSSIKVQIETRKPTIEWLANDVAVLNLPSFHIYQRDRIQSLFELNKKSLKNTKGLIIDLRENNDGHFLVLDTLLPVVGVREFQSLWYVLASDENTKFFYNLLNNDFIASEPKYYKRYSTLVTNMRLYRNTLLEYIWPWAANPDEIVNIEQIYIIQDKSVGGAAEEFILAAKTNPNVTTFGSATYGKLDYVLPIPHNILGAYQVVIPAKKRVWHFDGPINHQGLKPDVTIDPNHPQLKQHLYQRLLKSI